jgi:hypothetical protein
MEKEKRKIEPYTPAVPIIQPKKFDKRATAPEGEHEAINVPEKLTTPTLKRSNSIENMEQIATSKSNDAIFDGLYNRTRMNQ